MFKAGHKLLCSIKMRHICVVRLINLWRLKLFPCSLFFWWPFLFSFNEPEKGQRDTRWTLFSSFKDPRIVKYHGIFDIKEFGNNLRKNI